MVEEDTAVVVLDVLFVVIILAFVLVSVPVTDRIAVVVDPIRDQEKKTNWITYLIGLLILGGAGFFVWKKFIKKV